MKILYITNGITGAGGLERVLAVKASKLAEMGHEVHILTLNHNDAAIFYDFSPKIIYHDIKVTGSFISYILKYRKGIGHVIKDIKPDVISVCDDGLKGFFIPLLFKGCPIIYERHVSKIIAIGPDPSLLKRIFTTLKFGLMNSLAKNFDRFVVLTRDNISEWKLNNIVVIPNPLSFYPDSSSTLQNKKVIAVGKQSFQKGYDRLLESWQFVQMEHPDWELDIYGKFNPSQKLEEQAERLGITRSVNFYEAVRNIEEKYLESSIYVMSSRFEGFGMVLIEAMACGVPCVSFDCPCGPSDIIQHDVDGFLVKNGDINSLAVHISKLISDETMRKEMGKNAKQDVKRFLPEIIIKKWDDLFKELTA